MNPDKLTLAAYTRFGARGLKGIEMYYLVKEVWRKGHLRKVIAVSKKACRYDFDLNLIDTLPGQSRIISGLGQVQRRLWEAFPSRWLGEIIFDHYAASKLTGSTGSIVTTPRMIRTARKAKALGYKTLLYADHCDPRYLSKEIAAEQSAFGLATVEDNKNRSWQMARFTAHVGSSDFIIALSEYAKETYVHYGFPKENIVVAPLGIDLQRFRVTPPPADGPFVYLLMAHVTGTTGILKGLQYLLQAWFELNLKNAVLRVCGDIGREAQELIRRYSGKLRNVEFTGSVSNPQDYFQKSSVFVLPSLAEGLPKVVLEAMACGRPIITTAILKPVVREGVDGFYIPMRDVAALKDRMLYFYDHREEVARMGANASEQARSFTWERFSRQIADIFLDEPRQTPGSFPMANSAGQPFLLRVG
jgi:glycosyltransferase involved in cell wall biosynthesis